MPAKSQSQQRFFGMVDAYKKGKLKNPSKKIKKAAEDMTKKEVDKFASTKHKGLPEKVSENKMSILRITEEDLHRIVRESVNKMLNEKDAWYAHLQKDDDLPDNVFDGDDLDDETNMSPEEKTFRTSISPNFNQSNIDYLGKLSNGNSLITYRGVSFEVTPKGKMIRIKK